MATRHLYYEDSYSREFSAEITEVRAKGDRWLAVLDRSIFYPTSGGQPHDTGTLGTTRVLQVEEDSTGTILHLVDSGIGLGPVTGRIDWERRFDHMQQHTGQHILSQAFIQVASAQTLSFHLGQESCTIDVDLAQPAPSIMREAEDLACRVVFEDRPVRILNVDRAGLAALGVRKDSARDLDIRVIDVEGFDRSPCGGTHVRRSGEIGLIAVLGFERYKGGTRVEFACGGRALVTLRNDHEVMKTLGRLVSGHPYELPRLTEKLLEERSALARENSRLQEQILETEAAELLRNSDRSSGKAVVQARFTDRGLEAVKVLAQKIAAHPGSIAILAVVQESVQVVVSRSSDVPGDCGVIVKDTARRLGGKGGGRPELAQAGGIRLPALDAWIQSVASSLSQHS